MSRSPPEDKKKKGLVRRAGNPFKRDRKRIIQFGKEKILPTVKGIGISVFNAAEELVEAEAKRLSSETKGHVDGALDKFREGRGRATFRTGSP
jgi:hypothetical protein